MLKRNSLLICGVGFLLISCKSFTPITKAKTYRSNFFTRSVELDSLLEPCAADVVFSADKANLYRFKPLSHSDTIVVESDSIAGFPVDRKLATVKKQLPPLLFILSDSCFYSRDYWPVKQPFSPYIGVEFIKGENKTVYLFSLGTEEVRIVNDNKVIGTFQINDMRLLLRWCDWVVPDDGYIGNVKTKIK